MKEIGALKYKHENEKGVMHYVTFENQVVGLSQIKSLKIDYVDQYGKLDVAFDLKSKEFKTVSVEISNDIEFVKSVYEYMLSVDNTYFKDGQEGLCVLKFKE